MAANAKVHLSEIIYCERHSVHTCDVADFQNGGLSKDDVGKTKMADQSTLTKSLVVHKLVKAR